MSTPNRIVFNYRDFGSQKLPTNMLVSFDRDPRMTDEQTFDWAVAQMKAKYFKKKEVQRHD